MPNNTVRIVTVALVMLLSACGSATKPGSTLTPSAASAGPKADKNGWITYGTRPDTETSGPHGAEIKSQDDLRKLKGAPADFVTFVGKELKRLSAIPTAADIRECDGLAATIEVDRFHPEGFAVGSVWACADGGAPVIWTRGQSGWKQALDSAGAEDCADLRKIRLPEGGWQQCVEWKKEGSSKLVTYTGP
jgi:hypothetical protein